MLIPSLWEGTKGRGLLGVLALAFTSPTLADIKPIPLSPTAVAAGAVITHDKGIEFVTIGSPGNAAWPGNGVNGDRARGSRARLRVALCDQRGRERHAVLLNRP